MITSSDEAELISDLQEGLALAIRDHGLNTDSLKYLNKTKLQKLLYLAIREYELPITYNWYLAGAHIKECQVSIGHLESHLEFNKEDITESKARSLDFDRRPIAESRSDLGPPVNEYRRFYNQNLEKVWFTPLNDYLEEFYREYSPEEYRSLYLKSLELRKLFSNLIDKTKEPGTQRSLSDFGNGFTDIGIYPDFEQVINDLRFELVANDRLRNTAPDFERFAIILLKLMDHIEEYGLIGEENEDRNIIEIASEFYFFKAWKRPCLYIARDTAVGPNSDLLLENIEQKISRTKESYPVELAKFREQCRRHGVELDSFVNVSFNNEQL